jgi:hypothetical protein
VKDLDRELAHRELDRLFDRAPWFGEVIFTTHFRDGRIHNFNENISYSVVAERLLAAGSTEVQK